MGFHFIFLCNSLLLGLGLTADAFSVSLADGLNEPEMGIGKMCGIAGVFAFLQGLMPMIGWVCVRNIARHFVIFRRSIPWIALLLLVYMGSSMLIAGIKGRDLQQEPRKLKCSTVFLQGIATSIDALSVGFTIAAYDFGMALNAVLIISAVTFTSCLIGIRIGKKFGTRFAGCASLLGGILLIFIGLQIWISALG